MADDLFFQLDYNNAMKSSDDGADAAVVVVVCCGAVADLAVADDGGGGGVVAAVDAVATSDAVVVDGEGDDVVVDHVVLLRCLMRKAWRQPWKDWEHYQDRRVGQHCHRLPPLNSSLHRQFRQ